MTKIVFLDFDGVLCLPSTRYTWADASCIAALNRITGLTGAGIVVSSSRRSNLEGARILLGGWGANGEVLDLTPRPGVRSREIKAWLADHPIGAFVILDDDRLDADLVPYHVRTDPATGLTVADAERAIAILGEQGLWTCGS